MEAAVMFLFILSIKVRLMKRIVDGEMVEGILISFHEQEYPLVPYFQ